MGEGVEDLHSDGSRALSVGVYLEYIVGREDCLVGGIE